MKEIPMSLQGRSFEHMGSGTRKIALLSDNEVFKIAYFDHTLEQANLHGQQIQAEYDLISAHLNSSIATSDIYVEKGTKGQFLVIERQPYYVGVSMLEALNRSPGFDQRLSISAFLDKCLVMYKKTGHFPDVFGRVLNIGFYNVLTTPNVISVDTPNTDVKVPILIDTQINRLNKVKGIGQINAYFLFIGISYVKKMLEEK